MLQWCSVEGSYFPSDDFGVRGGQVMHVRGVLVAHRAGRGPTGRPPAPARANRLAVLRSFGGRGDRGRIP